MNKYLKVIVLLVIGVCSSIFAVTPLQIYSRQIPGANQFVNIEPLLGDQGQLMALIFSDHNSPSISIRYIDGDSAMILSIGAITIKTASYFDATTGAIHIYTLHNPSSRGPYIGHLLIDRPTITFYQILPDYYYGPYPNGAARSDLYLDSTGGQPSQVIIECDMNFSTFDPTQGLSGGVSATTLLYNLDLTERRLRFRASSMRFGRLADSLDHSAAFHRTYRYYWDYSDYPGDPNHGDVRHTTFGILEANFDTVLTHVTDSGQGHAIFIDEYDGHPGTDEIIYYGDAEDPLGFHIGKELHLACYTMSSGAPQQVWYRPTPLFDIQFSYDRDRCLVGWTSEKEIVRISSENGNIIDTIALDRTMSTTQFFSLGTADNQSLAVTGRSYDTVLVYKFDSPTSVENPKNSETIPHDFTLGPCYPNPFNATTQVQLELTRSAHVTATIHNIVGQRVSTLCDKIFSVGRHTLTWSASDNNGQSLASGIYFLNVQTASGQQVQKMVLMK